MAKLVINRGTTANDGTGDTLRTTALKINTNFDEIYTKLGDGSTLLSGLDFDSDRFSFLFTTDGLNKTTISGATGSGIKNIVFPNYTGNVVVDSATQTLLNKELTTPLLHEPRISDADSDYAYVLKATGHVTKDINLNLPVMTDSDEFIFSSHTGTLSNKTIESSVINDPRIVDTILDSSGNELISFVANNSAVSFIEIENKATASPVGQAIVRGAGEANTNLLLEGTGTDGGVQINDRLVYQRQNLTATGGTVNSTVPLTTLSINATGTHTLASGVTGQNGEIKHILNTGTGTQTINETSNNFANGASLALAQNASVTLVWISPQWHVLNTYGTVTIA